LDDPAFAGTLLEEHLVAESLAAESAEEAAALLGGGIVVALAPLPPVRAVAAPIVIVAGTRLTRLLHGHPGTRMLLPALPLIYRRAIGELARVGARPRRQTVRTALSRAARATLSNPARSPAAP